MMSVKSASIYSRIVNNYGLVVVIILFLGMMFGDSAHADLSSGDIFSTGKLSRLISVGLAGGLAIVFFSLRFSKGIKALFKGNLALLTAYGMLAFFTIVFSEIRMLTLFKSAEILIVVVVVALVLSERGREDASIFFVKVIFWVYVVSCVTALLETVIVGAEHHKTLVVGVTPLLSTMMQSTYPPMSGNGLGYLGALASMFGIYLYDSDDIKIKTIRRFVAVIVVLVGFSVLFLSYTRSILAFYLLGVIVLFVLEKRWLRVVAMLGSMVSALAMPQVQEKIVDHLRRGSSDEQLASLSGRTDFWADIFSRDPLQLLVGEGFAAGSRMAYFRDGNLINAHNSIAEIVVNVGVIGAVIWLMLMLRIGFNLLKIRRRLKRARAWSLGHFHNFMMVIYMITMLRTLMNSSLVYLDYFFFMVAAFAVYTEAFLLYRPKNMMSAGKTRAVRKGPNIVGATSFVSEDYPRVS